MLRPRCSLGTAPTLREMATTWSSSLTDGQRRTYAEDGVVHVPGAVDTGLLADIEVLVDRQLADPGPWVTDTGPEPAAGRLFTTRYLWRTEPAIRSFVFGSGMAELAAALGVERRLRKDHLDPLALGGTARRFHLSWLLWFRSS